MGFPTPDFELFLTDGSTVRLYELLRANRFVVLDLSGARSLGGVRLPVEDVAIVEAHPIRKPKALAGVAAMIVRPDTYVAWTSPGPPQPDDVLNELDRILARTT